MHNDEGTLFNAVFYKLLTLGVVIVSVAAAVWIVWAIVRMSAITNEAAGSETGRGADTSLVPAAGHERLLADAHAAGPARSGTGEPDRIIALLLGPVARGLVALDEHLDRVPGLVADAAFFSGGPS
jgi:hypothetical protein